MPKTNRFSSVTIVTLGLNLDYKGALGRHWNKHELCCHKHGIYMYLFILARLMTCPVHRLPRWGTSLGYIEPTRSHGKLCTEILRLCRRRRTQPPNRLVAFSEMFYMLSRG